MAEQVCVCCGGPVRVVSGEEGTSHYESLAAEQLAAVEAERDVARAQVLKVDGWREAATAERDAARAALGRLHIAANSWLDDYINGDQPSWSDKLRDDLCDALADPTGQAAAERWRALESETKWLRDCTAEAELALTAETHLPCVTPERRISAATEALRAGLDALEKGKESRER